MRYALNSAVIPSPGLFRYRLLSPEEAGAWWRSGTVEARIGYRETCTAVARVLGLGTAPEVDRRACHMEPGDPAGEQHPQAKPVSVGPDAEGFQIVGIVVGAISRPKMPERVTSTSRRGMP